MAKTNYNTESIVLLNGKCCVYCGELIQYETEVEDREIYYYSFCDCEGAKLEIEIYEKQNQLSQIKKQAFNTILKPKLYALELKKVHDKYKA